jgi:hypothetical protein
MLQSKMVLICNVVAMLLALAMAIIAVVRWKSLPPTLVARYDIDGRPNSWSGRGVIWFYPALTLVLLALTDDKMGPFNLFVAAMLLYQMLRTLQIVDKRARALHPWFVPVLMLGGIALLLFIHL